MLLRSSSTPATGSLLSPFIDSPKRDCDTINNTHTNTIYTKQHPLFHEHKLSFPYGIHHNNLTTLSYSFRLEGFRRAWSDSKLDKLVCVSGDVEDSDNTTITPRKFPHRDRNTMLHTAPSFSIFNANEVVEGEDKDGGKEEAELLRTVTIGESIEAVGGGGEFCFEHKNMGLIEEEGEGDQEGGGNGVGNFGFEEEKEPPSPPLYLAAGLGIGGYDFGSGGGGGADFTLPDFDENGDVEEYYKRMLDRYPCHPLFLTNYGQLLQSKGDLHGAEDYYYRATLADPGDGQILLQHAKLVWELYHDRDRALHSFQRAAQAAPNDSHVIAAYASFLWEIDDNGEEDESRQEYFQLREEETLNCLNTSATGKDYNPLKIPPGIRTDFRNCPASEDVEEHYKRMIEENFSNSLVLRNYAQFLRESKGDPQGAEEYYLRAVQADPSDGEIISQYANLVWELHHDHDKASCYYEQAVQATPDDSYVLAAYASFLWETGEDEEEDSIKPKPLSGTHS